MQKIHEEERQEKNKQFTLYKLMEERKEMVANQVQAHQLHKKLNDQEKRRYEKKLVSDLKQKIEAEKEKEREKKKFQRNLYAKIHEENEVLKAKLQQDKLKEMERDKKFIEDYNKMIETQATKRKQEREERNNKIKARMEIMGGKILKDQGQKDKEHEMLLLNGIKLKEAKEKSKENKKMMIMKRDQTDLRNFLATQVEEKHKKKDLEQQKNKWFVDQELKQAMREKEEDKVKQQQRKKREIENSQFIASQIAAKNDPKDSSSIGRCGARGMNAEEYLLNKKLLMDISKKKQAYKQELFSTSI
ncbi:unnamed protein product [Moneuplotes crassus]|uniref:Trichohyalin-plectin-homology domain-containing protein n=1 Tax=Euplotes crassus TaxID=5936 RepID=A0AAD1U4A5_EUPCR|nr:unnamed protein product [Moneuplotes crassus]